MSLSRSLFLGLFFFLTLCILRARENKNESGDDGGDFGGVCTGHIQLMPLTVVVSLACVTPWVENSSRTGGYILRAFF